MDLLPAPSWLIAIDQSTILPVDWFACREETQVLAARDCELFDADHNTALGIRRKSDYTIGGCSCQCKQRLCRLDAMGVTSVLFALNQGKVHSQSFSEACTIRVPADAFSQGSEACSILHVGGAARLTSALVSPTRQNTSNLDLCGLLLLIVDTILLPLSLAFGWTSGTQDAGSFILLLDFIASVFFWTLDIFMNVNTAFYSKGALVYDRHAIVRHYVKTWLLGLTAALAGSPYSPLVSAAVHTLDLSAFTPPP